MLVGLYEEPERPANAIDYIKKHLSGINEVEKYKKENEELKKKVQVLEKTIGQLRLKVEEKEENQNDLERHFWERERERERVDWLLRFFFWNER